MPYSPETGHVNDALFRRQSADVAAGNYPVEPAPKASIGDSTTSVDIDVSAGVVRFGNEFPGVTQQKVTLPAGPEIGSGPEGGDPERVDLITIDRNGTAGRMVGEPAVPIDGNGKPTERSFPNVIQPVPRTPTPSDNVVVIAAVNVKAGVTASQEMFADAIVPREVMGDGLNDLDLIPGRDLQYEIDQAREGQTLRGDRSQTILLDQPLTVNTKDLTIRDLNLRYAAGAAANDTDDMLTLAADGASVENVTLDGNKNGQSADADGVTVKASECSVENIRGRRTAGHLVNVNGESRTVENTVINGVVGENLAKDALVIQGAGVYRVTATTVYGFGSDQRGTLTVRNGTDWVSVSEIYGEQQNHAIKVEDFGSGSASDAIVSFDASNVRARGCSWLVANNTSSDINHRGLALSGLYGRDFSPGTRGGIVDVGHFSGVKISRAFLNDDYSGAYAIDASDADEVQITDSTLRNAATDRGGINLVNADLALVSGVYIRPTTGATNAFGIHAVGGDGDHGFIMATGNVIGANCDTSIRFGESAGGNLANIMAVNNAAPVIENNTDAASENVIIKDNL